MEKRGKKNVLDELLIYKTAAWVTQKEVEYTHNCCRKSEHLHYLLQVLKDL
jgi:hypothetical protein